MNLMAITAEQDLARFRSTNEAADERSPNRAANGDQFPPEPIGGVEDATIRDRAGVRRAKESSKHRGDGRWAGDFAAQFTEAWRAARPATAVAYDRKAETRNVAAGVAVPALSAVIWMLEEAQENRGLRRLRFPSRDGQVLFEVTRRLSAKLRLDIDPEYVYSSRLAATSQFETL